MLRSTFLNLDPKRRERLLDACAREFATKGYDMASTNTIARVAGIAKGSFFKYFGSKESVYLHLVGGVFEDLGELQGARATYESRDIIARAEQLFTRHMEYARRSPARYRLVLRALLETESPVYVKVAALRAGVSRRTARYLYAGIDWNVYRHPRADVVEFLRCLDLGLRQAAVESLGVNASIGAFASHVRRSFALARRVLVGGLYRNWTQEEET